MFVTYQNFYYLLQNIDIIFMIKGGRTADEIVSWLKKKTGPVAATLASVDETKESIEKNDVFVVGFFKDVETDSAKAFLSAAASIDDVSFGITSDEGVFAEYKVEGETVVLFKKVNNIYIYEYIIKNIYKN